MFLRPQPAYVRKDHQRRLGPIHARFNQTIVAQGLARGNVIWCFSDAGAISSLSNTSIPALTI